ncbi:MAG: ribonuclease III [Paraprevotella sp.]|nr:ribonuclease III [Paraprevotella sp.]
MYPKDFIERIKLPFRKDKELYSSFYRMLGFYPIRIHYYEQALHHKSSSIRREGNWINNERLEFLGDAILDAVVGDIVYRHFEGKREGFLTNTRSKIVQRETLNKLAVEIGLDKLIISSAQNSTHNSYMCGNAFEAIVGAIYLDRGYSYCMRFIRQRIMTHLINLDKVAYQEVNFKSKLIEWGQKRKVEVSFDLIDQDKEGSSTPVFTTQVNIEGLACCKGKGYSKKESQQLAAKATLAMLKKTPKLTEQILAYKNRKEQLSKAMQGTNEQEYSVVSEDTAQNTAQKSDNADETYDVPSPEIMEETRMES